nr:MFS transporter [Actinomycetota bacterium]
MVVAVLGGAAGLVAVFSLLVEPGGPRSIRASWLRAAVLSTAMGPALGGAITQVLSWEWIFVAQAPIAATAALL